MPVVVVPAIVAVPLPLSVKVRPPGRAPDSVRAGAGSPVVETVKLNGAPTIEVAERRADDGGGDVLVQRLGGAGAEVDPIGELAAVGATERARR